MPKRPLYTSASAQFVSDGAGGTIAQVEIGPNMTGANVKWNVTKLVSSTSSTKVNGYTRLDFYRNFVSNTTAEGGTFSADDGNPSDENIDLSQSDKLIFVWRKGSLGSFATIVVQGTSDDGR